MKRTVAVLLLLLGALLLTSAAGFAAEEKDIERVASQLSCYCGTCPHLVVTQCGCGTADKIMKEVGTMLDQGMTDKQIIQSFVDRYGNTVLSSPPKSGFNLTAYLIPFGAFLLGGTVLVAFLKHQRNGKDQGPKPPQGYSEKPLGTEDERYNELLNQELDKRK
jgi:cytochrome c-type biogenesis protein CcmH